MNEYLQRLHEEATERGASGWGNVGEWTYKSEGAAHAVFGWNGACGEVSSAGPRQYVRSVLRLRTSPRISSLAKKPTAHKSQVSDGILAWFHDRGLGHPSDEWKSHAFVSCVMQPALGADVVFSGEPVVLPPRFVQGLEDRWESFRPPHRRQASSIVPVDDPVRPVLAYLQPDLTAGEGRGVICVEIKPKFGSLARGPVVSGDSIKRRVTRYEMHQCLKLAEGSIEGRSAYCPMDLFSNDAARIRRAVCALLDAPQNNLKVFVDGSLTYTGALGGGMSQDCRNQEHLKAAIHPRFDSINALADALVLILTEHSVLSKLHALQLLDRLDIEAAAPLAAWLAAQKPLSDEELLQEARMDTLAPPRTLMDSVLRNRVDAAVERFFSADSDVVVVSEQDRGLLRLALRDFLVAATAKDCSLMVTFDDAGSRIAVVDLEPKSLDQIPRWLKLDQQIVHEYQSYSKTVL